MPNLLGKGIYKKTPQKKGKGKNKRIDDIKTIVNFSSEEENVDTRESKGKRFRVSVRKKPCPRRLSGAAHSLGLYCLKRYRADPAIIKNPLPVEQEIVELKPEDVAIVRIIDKKGKGKGKKK